MEAAISSLLQQHSTELFGVDIQPVDIQISKTRRDVPGDYTLVVFPFVKIWKCSPQDAGKRLGDFLLHHTGEIESYDIVGGFLNLHLAKSYWIGVLNGLRHESSDNKLNRIDRPTVMVEFASPNTNKPLHLGHLRNIFLGFSVSRILEEAGNHVIKTQVINDRGIHICKSMLAWQKFSPINELGERETPSNTGLKGDKLVGTYYVVFDRELNQEASAILDQWFAEERGNVSDEVFEQFRKLHAMLEGKDEKSAKGIQDKIKELAKANTAIMQEAKDMLIRWEARDPSVYLLWNAMNGWVYDGFDQTYERMGVSFDKNYYESDTYLLGKDIVLDGLSKGIFFKKADGSVWIDLTDEGLDEKLVLRSDGTSVYMTQDIGTALDRFKDYPNLSSIIYTVGNEQDYHFKVLFLILKKMGYDWANQCHHLSYGMVDLPSGKMKSREGTVVDADDLMEEVVQQATEMTKERGHIDGMTDEQKNALFEMIGMGGLKYYLLKVDPKKRMLFNPEESIDLTGHTGPFIQYGHARIQSLLRKSGEKVDQFTVQDETEISQQEADLIQMLSAYAQVIQDAAKQYSPALVANYVYELVKEYNHFYQTTPILIEPDSAIRCMRLALSEAVAQTIKKSMNVLGIDVPDRM
jgi:arginyl-tRNA synthetase